MDEHSKRNLKEIQENGTEVPGRLPKVSESSHSNKIGVPGTPSEWFLLKKIFQ